MINHLAGSVAAGPLGAAGNEQSDSPSLVDLALLEQARGGASALSPESPFLRVDLDMVAQRYSEFTAAFPGVRVHYAIKCNSDQSVLLRLHDAGCGFEVASACELDDLRAIGVNGADVLFSNPVKSNGDIGRAAGVGLWRFACDSSAELEKLAALAPGAAVYFRLGVSPALSDVPSEGKFGVEAGDVHRLALQAAHAGLRPYGITFHVGSQMTRVSAWTHAIADAGDVLRSLAKRDIVMPMFDIGGGFPVRYDANVPSFAEIGAAVKEAIAKYVPYRVFVVAEPGRALVAEAGTMVATVIGIADRRGRRWIHLDVGAFNGMMEALETRNELRFPISDSLGSRRAVSCHLTGPSCDSQDTILFDVPMSADLAVGDTVYIGSAGAYTTGYASNFNGCAIPPVVAATGPLWRTR